MKPKPPEKEPSSERWLLTYADLITLLMIFFVVMYALSSVDAKKFQQLAQALSGVFGGSQSFIGTTGGPAIVPQPGAQLPDRTYDEIQDYIQQHQLQQQVSALREDRGVVVTLDENFLFQSGRAEIAQPRIQALANLGKVLASANNYIRVEGHTDNVPIAAGPYHSNWQLSSARATYITELLIAYAGIRPQRLSAMGYGEYRPIADNATEAGRAKNRRVEIVLLNPKYDSSERNAR
ncbi:MAG: OmpA family protein [Candidatus Lambdaproteobacteria bacterium]|nr:OmpA family protein [Candidatus Lambdaproteobacteria bacterium]